MITKLGAKLALAQDKESDGILGPVAAGTVGALGGNTAAAAAHAPVGLSFMKYMPRIEGGDIHLTEQELAQVAEHMGARGVPIDRLHRSESLRGHFNPLTKRIGADPTSYVVAHEMGHASGLLGKAPKYLGTGLGYLTHVVGGPGIASLVRAADSAHKEYNKARGLSDGDNSAVLDGASKLTMVGTGAQLAEEGQATVRALRAINKVQGRAGMLKAMKMLGPAYGTYLAGAAASHGVAPWVGGAIGRSLAGDS